VILTATVNKLHYVQGESSSQNDRVVQNLQPLKQHQIYNL